MLSQELLVPMELLAEAKTLKGPHNDRADLLEVWPDSFDVVRSGVKLEHPPGQRRGGGLELREDPVAPRPPVRHRKVRQPHVVWLQHLVGSHQRVLRAENEPGRAERLGVRPPQAKQCRDVKVLRRYGSRALLAHASEEKNPRISTDERRLLHSCTL